MAPIAQLLRTEIEGGEGSSFIVDRALEILCAAAIRQHLADELVSVGFARAVKDPRIGAALTAMHIDPAARWSIDSLAVRAGMSRSRFATLFTELAGEAPMSYLTRWRINLAQKLLRTSDRGIAEIAAEVGYDSVSAFSRTFKRLVGEPPGRTRRPEA